MSHLFLLSKEKTQNKLQKQIILSSSLGGVLEFYELTVFGFLTPILSEIFFWPGFEHSKIFTYLVFAIGFIFRPLGAILFGHLGDRYSRKQALYLSILLMGVATCCMGFLPGTNSVGITAPLLLIFLRILQGISAGGEFNGAILMAVENTNTHRKGFISSFVGSSGMVGMVIGGIVAKLILNSSAPIFYWRYAFLPGVFLALLSVYLRRMTFKNYVQPQQEISFRIPLFEAFKTSSQSILGSFFVAASAGLIIYTKSIFEAGIESKTEFTSLMTTILLMIFPPLLGLCSDFFGRSRIMSMGMIGVIILLILSSFKIQIMGSILIYCLFASMYLGPMHAWMIERFRYSSRYSAIGFSYSLGIGLVGGTAPLISQYLYELTKTNLFINLYVGFVGFLTLYFCYKINLVSQSDDVET